MISSISVILIFFSQFYFFNTLNANSLSWLKKYPSQLFVQPAQLTRSDKFNDVLSNCTQYYFTQDLDHFDFRPAVNGQTTYQERYFVCGGQYWKPNNTIFFYTGNEADVELYINNTGLMWENADSFEAVMVFAEHRYFGKSLPFPLKNILEPDYLYYLSSDQALADYAILIHYLKIQWNSWNSPVIGFGGSYGGMLCSWFRMKYPAWMDGCIAGSAPIVSFLGLNPPVNDNFYAQIETYDCSSKSQTVTDNCKNNIHLSWSTIFSLGTTLSGRQKLQEIFHLCSTPSASEYGYDVADWISSAISSMTMGSYPFASSYMLMGDGILPPYPMQLGCNSYLNTVFNNNITRLEAMYNMVSIFYNYSQSLECYDINLDGNNETTLDGELWNYLYCTELLMPFGQDGINDMFWYAPWDLNETMESCKLQYGSYPRPYFASINYGGWNNLKSSSNIVFSNGEYDPWRGAGINMNISQTITSIIIPKCGHHVDLFFSNPNDTSAIKEARNYELQQIRIWVQDALKYKYA